MPLAGKKIPCISSIASKSVYNASATVQCNVSMVMEYNMGPIVNVGSGTWTNETADDDSLDVNLVAKLKTDFTAGLTNPTNITVLAMAHMAHIILLDQYAIRYDPNGTPREVCGFMDILMLLCYMLIFFYCLFRHPLFGHCITLPTFNFHIFYFTRILVFDRQFPIAKYT